MNANVSPVAPTWSVEKASVAPHMVSSRAAPAGTFTLSASAQPAKALLALSKWPPRRGRSPQYFELEHSLHQWCMAREISYAALPLPAPVHENVLDEHATRKSAKEQEERDARFLVAYAEWQHYNAQSVL